jgi:leucyl/phenylalanyl-tRNA--protein transferase
MPVYRLGELLAFPPPGHAEPDGLLAVGGDLRPERLLLAYSEGIFPWYDDSLPILWYAPDPRLVLVPEELHVARSLQKTVRQERFRITLDGAFTEVVAACAHVSRAGQSGTWITGEMEEAYCQLHASGYAHSVEAWLGERLVGGLYGLSLGAAFFGESMFHLLPDASKVAFVTLVRQLQRWKFRLVDCQVHTEHLERFGARPWPRDRFSSELRVAQQVPTRRGRWELED